MSRVSFNRKRAKLKKLLGIRARLALLGLILVAPLMLERARSLEDTRSKQIALASAEFASLANHSADMQREVISSVETVLNPNLRWAFTPDRDVVVATETSSTAGFSCRCGSSMEVA